MEGVHKIVAGVAGEIALALARGSGTKRALIAWRDRLQRAVELLDAKIG